MNTNDYIYKPESTGFGAPKGRLSTTAKAVKKALELIDPDRLDTAEQAIGILVDSAYRVKDMMIMSIGSECAAEIEPPDVIRRMVKVKATRMFFIHTHPAGDMSFTKADMKLMMALQKLLREHTYAMADAIIISGQDPSVYMSAMAEQNMGRINEDGSIHAKG